MVIEEVDFGQYVTTEQYKGIAFWVDDWAKDIVDKYFQSDDIGDSGEVYYGWEEVEVQSDCIVECYMVGDDRVHRFDIADLNVVDINDFCVSCGQIGCGHG